MNALFSCGRGFARLVFDFVLGLQRGFLALVCQVMQPIIALMGHLAESVLGMGCVCIQTTWPAGPKLGFCQECVHP